MRIARARDDPAPQPGLHFMSNMLQMPYLHFETNEGRIRLKNAIKRTAIESTKMKMEDDTKIVPTEGDPGANTKIRLNYEDGDPSKSASGGGNTKGKAARKVRQLNGVSYLAPEEANLVLTYPSKTRIFQRSH